jgi:hypothetical protein
VAPRVVELPLGAANRGCRIMTERVIGPEAEREIGLDDRSLQATRAEL